MEGGVGGDTDMGTLARFANALPQILAMDPRSVKKHAVLYRSNTKMTYRYHIRSVLSLYSAAETR